jgi:hypothetical protein
VTHTTAQERNDRRPIDFWNLATDPLCALPAFASRLLPSFVKPHALIMAHGLLRFGFRLHQEFQARFMDGDMFAFITPPPRISPASSGLRVLALTYSPVSVGSLARWLGAEESSVDHLGRDGVPRAVNVDWCDPASTLSRHGQYSSVVVLPTMLGMQTADAAALAIPHLLSPDGRILVVSRAWETAAAAGIFTRRLHAAGWHTSGHHRTGPAHVLTVLTREPGTAPGLTQSISEYLCIVNGGAAAGSSGTGGAGSSSLESGGAGGGAGDAASAGAGAEVADSGADSDADAGPVVASADGVIARMFVYFFWGRAALVAILRFYIGQTDNLHRRTTRHSRRIDLPAALITILQHALPLLDPMSGGVSSTIPASRDATLTLLESLSFVPIGAALIPCLTNAWTVLNGPLGGFAAVEVTASHGFGLKHNTNMLETLCINSAPAAGMTNKLMSATNSTGIFGAFFSRASMKHATIEQCKIHRVVRAASSPSPLPPPTLRTLLAGRGQRARPCGHHWRQCGLCRRTHGQAGPCCDRTDVHPRPRPRGAADKSDIHVQRLSVLPGRGTARQVPRVPHRAQVAHHQGRPQLPPRGESDPTSHHPEPHRDRPPGCADHGRRRDL